VNAPQKLSVHEECQSDMAHARLLSSRVELHNGVWIVDDNVLLHDKCAVKLSVSAMIYFSPMHVCVCLITVKRTIEIGPYLPKLL